MSKSVAAKEQKYTRQQVPRELLAGVRWLDQLARAGVVAEIGARFQLERRSDAGTLAEGFAFLFLFFAQVRGIAGLRGFWTAFRDYAEALGGVAGFAKLMSSTALSRLLQATQVSDVAGGARWLLLRASGALELLREEALQVRDGLDQRWHVFYFDPSRQAFRQRTLDNPASKRRVFGLTARGHLGRKRGEEIMSEGMLHHAITGFWLDATIAAGNGEPRRQLGSAVEAVVETCQALEFPVSRALLIADGEFGGVPSFDCAQAAGIAYLSRVSRYDLLDLPEIRSRMQDARWEEVASSGSGPRRYAADLGEFALPAGESTRRADGSAYGPVSVRLLLSRYDAPPTEKTGELGRRLEGQVIEMFASIRLEAAAWSAADLVASYFGRTTIENRFAQLDRELDIETICSYAPGGRLFGLLCALFVWNFQIAQGAKMALPLPQPPPATPRPGLVPQSEAPSALIPVEPEILAPEPMMKPAPDPPPAPNGALLSAPPCPSRHERIDIAAIVRQRRPDWRWEPSDNTLRDPDGTSYRLASSETRGHRLDLRFTSDRTTGPYRQASLAVPKELREEVRSFLALQPKSIRQKSGNSPTVSPPSREDRMRSWILCLADDATPLPYFLPHYPPFLPAEARKLACDDNSQTLTWVLVHSQPIPNEPRHPLMAASPVEVGHRRHSQTAREARRGLPAGRSVRLVVGVITQRGSNRSVRCG